MPASSKPSQGRSPITELVACFGRRRTVPQPNLGANLGARSGNEARSFLGFCHYPEARACPRSTEGRQEHVEVRDVRRFLALPSLSKALLARPLLHRAL